MNRKKYASFSIFSSFFFSPDSLHSSACVLLYEAIDKVLSTVKNISATNVEATAHSSSVNVIKNSRNKKKLTSRDRNKNISAQIPYFLARIFVFIFGGTFCFFKQQDTRLLYRFQPRYFRVFYCVDPGNTFFFFCLLRRQRQS